MGQGLTSERVSQRERRFVQVALGGGVLHGLLERLDGLQQLRGCAAIRRREGGKEARHAVRELPLEQAALLHCRAPSRAPRPESSVRALR